MTTLYKRATPQQQRILRIIEGAVKNACDAHKVTLPHNFARSIAKRAAGTLTAQWPEVLAAMPSDGAGSNLAKNRNAGPTAGVPNERGGLTGRALPEFGGAA